MPWTRIDSSAWTKTVAVGVVAVASIVGNVSLSASEDGRSDSEGAVPLSHHGAADVTKAGRSGVTPEPSGFGFSEFHSVSRNSASSVPSDKTDGGTAGEEGQVVPAIYAWDPDVRFVFYRHVSKWM